MRFIFEVHNDYTRQVFHCEADDIVGATMTAMDHLGKLNEELDKLDRLEDINPFVVRAIEECSTLPADGEGIRIFLNDLLIQYDM